MSMSVEAPSLLPAVARGDTAAFEELYDRHSGILYALRASTGGKVYESTPQDTGGEFHRFITPAIANGRVYVGSVHAVTAFGLR